MGERIADRMKRLATESKGSLSAHRSGHDLRPVYRNKRYGASRGYGAAGEDKQDG